jgi:hypothetical protein
VELTGTDFEVDTSQDRLGVVGADVEVVDLEERGSHVDQCISTIEIVVNRWAVLERA